MLGANCILTKSMDSDDKDSKSQALPLPSHRGWEISYNLIGEAGRVETDKLESKIPV